MDEVTQVNNNQVLNASDNSGSQDESGSQGDSDSQGDSGPQGESGSQGVCTLTFKYLKGKYWPRSSFQRLRSCE